MKRHINLNEFKKLGMEFDIEDKTYKIDFIPAPIEEDMFSKFDELNSWLADPTKLNQEQKDIISDWIWQTVNFDRNGNGDIDKNYFFSYIGVTERFILLTLIIDLIGDRMKKMQEIFSDPEKKTVKNIKT